MRKAENLASVIFLEKKGDHKKFWIGRKTSNSRTSLISQFYEFLMPPIKDTFKLVKNSLNRKFPVNDWFDQECKSLKRKVNDLFKIDPWSTEADALKKEYDRITQRKKRAGKKSVSTKAHDLKANKPQDFWDFWKLHAKKKRNCDPDIDVTNFTEFYENVQKNHLTANDENYNHNFMGKIEKLISEIDIDREINMYNDTPVFDALKIYKKLGIKI